jgi:hypothetical protein
MNLEELFNAGINLMQQRKHDASVQTMQQRLEIANSSDCAPANIYFCLAQAYENAVRFRH